MRKLRICSILMPLKLCKVFNWHLSIAKSFRSVQKNNDYPTLFSCVSSLHNLKLEQVPFAFFAIPRKPDRKNGGRGSIGQPEPAIPNLDLSVAKLLSGVSGCGILKG